MTSRSRIDFDQVQADVLMRLYDAFRSDREGVAISSMAAKMGLPRNVVRMVVRDEIRAGKCRENYIGPDVNLPRRPFVLAKHISTNAWMEEAIDPKKIYLSPDNRSIEITRAGVEWIEGLDDAEYEEASVRLAASAPAAPSGVSIPASDRTVTLNHNQPEYQDAVTALDAAIEGIRGDQNFDNEWGPEKTALLNVLAEGRAYLDREIINVRIGVTLIIEPLRILAEKYRPLAVAATLNSLIDKAIEAGLRLFN